MSINLSLSYYNGITQNIDPSEINRQIKNFTALLQDDLLKRLGAEAVINALPAVDVPEQIKRIASGEHQIALMNPLGYVFARNINNAVVPVSVAERLIDGEKGVTYFSQIYTNKKTAIKDPQKDPVNGMKQLAKQLAEKSIGFGRRLSTSNFLVAASELKKIGVHLLHDFRASSFWGITTLSRALFTTARWISEPAMTGR